MKSNKRIQQMRLFSVLLLIVLCVFIVNGQNCLDSSRLPGQCRALSACTALLEQQYNGAALYMYSTDFSTYMGASICGFDGAQFLICCPTQQPPRYQPLPSVQMVPSVTSAPTSSSAFQFIPLNSVSGAVNYYVPPAPAPWQAPSSPTSPQPTSTSPIIFQPSPVNVPPTPVTPSFPQPPQPPQPPTTKVAVPVVPPAPPAPPALPSTATCGRIQGTINRVVGGNEAKRGSYPWIVALAYNEGGGIQYLCSGSLIASTYIATSAHCINTQLAYVRLGAHNLADATEAGAVNVRIKRTVSHEQFDIKSVVNDIALIELSTPAPQTAMIATICLPDSDNFLTQDFVGMNPFVAGWGATKYQGATSTRLRDVQVPIVTRQTCEASYKSVFSYVQFNERFICAGNSNVDACQGDSGGPLMLPQLDSSGNYRFYLLGIVSYGYECARPGFPGVYTRVASFMPWIKRNMI